MQCKNQKGFSLIELILVLVIISVLATITFPFLLKAKTLAENKSALATMRTASSAQVSYFGQNRRFARLAELNTSQNGIFGNVSGTQLIRGKFTFQMAPIAPTDAQLQDGYSMVATKAVAGSELPCIISVDQTGVIVEITTC